MKFLDTKRQSLTDAIANSELANKKFVLPGKTDDAAKPAEKQFLIDLDYINMSDDISDRVAASRLAKKYNCKLKSINDKAEHTTVQFTGSKENLINLVTSEEFGLDRELDGVDEMIKEDKDITPVVQDKPTTKPAEQHAKKSEPLDHTRIDEAVDRLTEKKIVSRDEVDSEVAAIVKEFPKEDSVAILNIILGWLQKNKVEVATKKKAKDSADLQFTVTDTDVLDMLANYLKFTNYDEANNMFIYSYEFGNCKITARIDVLNIIPSAILDASDDDDDAIDTWLQNNKPDYASLDKAYQAEELFFEIWLG